MTELLSVGDHTMTVQLADGWYRGGCGAWGIRNQYGTETKLLAQLEISYADGKRDLIVADESWDWSNDGPIRFADNKDGEVVNANREPRYKGIGEGVFIMRRPRLIILRTCSCLCDNHLACSQSAS